MLYFNDKNIQLIFLLIKRNKFNNLREKILYLNFRTTLQHLMNSSLIDSKITKPSHSQWGILNNLKQQQYEQATRMQKYYDYQKKQKFRSQLDKQLKLKSKSFMTERQADKAYSQFITQKARRQQQRQRDIKLHKYNMRRSMEQQNQKHLEEQKMMKSSRTNQTNTSQQKYVIGYRDNSLSGYQQDRKKKQMMRFLDEQVRQKQQMKKQEKSSSINQFYKSLQQQDKMAKSQNFNKAKFKQNDKVYQYYQQLYKHKQQLNKSIQYAIVDKSIQKKNYLQQMTQLKKQQAQNLKKKNIKDVLDQQVHLHKIQLRQQKQPKPQQISYSYFQTMFGSKGYGNYDKKQYNQYLQRQMQTQRANKKNLEFMNQKQYLLNINLINKALNGNYLNQRYQDLSLANVGQKLKSDAKQAANQLNYSSHRNELNQQNPQLSNSSIQNTQKQSKNLDNNDRDIVKKNLNQLLKNYPNNLKIQKQRLGQNRQSNNSNGNRNRLY